MEVKFGLMCLDARAEWPTAPPMASGSRARSWPWAAHRYFSWFLDFFLNFNWFFFLGDIKKKVVYCRVGPWVLFYLVSQSGEPCIGERNNCELKSWLTSWCGRCGPPLVSQKTGSPLVMLCRKRNKNIQFRLAFLFWTWENINLIGQ